MPALYSAGYLHVPEEIASASEPDDATLLLETARGNRAAFETLVARHQAAVYRYARAIAQNDADAEDLLQETFLSAFLFAAGFRGDSSVRTWLLVIARNAALRLRARNSRASADAQGEAPLAELGWRAGWSQDDPESLAICAQRRDRLERALRSLPPEYREILVLRDLEGLSGPETAQLLGCGLPAMKSRLHRARLSLAAALREGGNDD